MLQDCRKKYPSLHYAAMDEPGAEGHWYLLAEATKGADKATTRITEASVIATMHTFTLNSYTTILRTDGIVESASNGRVCHGEDAL